MLAEIHVDDEDEYAWVPYPDWGSSVDILANCNLSACFVKRYRFYTWVSWTYMLYLCYSSIICEYMLPFTLDNEEIVCHSFQSGIPMEALTCDIVSVFNVSLALSLLLPPPLPLPSSLPAWHGLQQGDVLRPVEVRVLHSVHEVHELHPRRRGGEEGDGGVQAAADGGSEATGREQTDQGAFCSPHVHVAPPSSWKDVDHGWIQGIYTVCRWSQRLVSVALTSLYIIRHNIQYLDLMLLL